MRDRRWLALLVAVLVLACASALLLLTDRGERPDRSSDRRASATRDGDGEAGSAEAGAPPGEKPDGEEGSSSAAAGTTNTEEGSDAEEEEFSFEKETNWSVTVRVLDREGKPLESVVEIVDPRVEWSFGELPEKGPGAFAGFLPEPGWYAAEALRGGTRLRVAFEITEAEPSADVEIRYAGTGVISGALYSTLGSL